MRNEFKRYYQRIEERKRDMLQYMDALSDQERRRQPKPSELSPLQVLAHVVFVEETVSGPNEALPPNNKVQMKGRLFMLLLVGMMRPGFRIPTAPELHPTGKIDYEETKRQWDAVRNALRCKLDSVSDRDKDAPIALQMMAGPMSADMVLDFLDVHLRYRWKNFPKVRA